MALFGARFTSASGLTAQRLRMDLIAGNLANAATTRTAAGGPYRRRLAVLAERGPGFAGVLQGALGGAAPEPAGVQVAGIVEDPSPLRLRYDPSHPDADAQGYVRLPNVDTVTEMVDLIAASRAYEANATAITDLKGMVHRALEIGR